MIDTQDTDDYHLTLEVDGAMVPMKQFVREIIAGALIGMLARLKGVDDPDRIVVTIERRRPASEPNAVARS
jgi:hypothetical protein